MNSIILFYSNAFLYYPFYAGFNLLTFLANWIKLVCFNFPFALLSQLFFIQPLVRTVFKAILCLIPSRLVFATHNFSPAVLTETAGLELLS